MGQVLDVAAAIYALWSMGTGVITFAGLFLIVPQLAGLIVNRATSRWVIVSRVIGVLIPLVVVVRLWSDVADRGLERQRAAGNDLICGTGAMSGFLLLPAVHLLAAFLAQAVLPYGKRGRAQ